MEKSEYLKFLRWCLHPSQELPQSFSIINWQRLLEFAKKQTIVGIYWQGIQRLSADIDNKLSEDEVMEWIGEYQKITRRNAKVDSTVSKLSTFLNNKDVSFFVFKGQTIARSYHIPESRTSGDVDFYVFMKDWETAKKLLSTNVEITNAHSFRHLEFTYDGIPFEMHYHTAVFASKRKQKYWDELIDSYFDDVLDHVKINDVEVPTLPPTLNAIYLFVHIYHHLLKEGIALRQFIDWMMFFEAKHEEIVVSELTAKLEWLGLLRAFKAFGAVLIDVLGMDAKFFPYALSDSDKRYVDKIMSIGLQYGNFGKYGRSTPTLLKKEGAKDGRLAAWWHSIETGSRSVRHFTQFFWLSPAENLLWLPKLV